MTGQDQRNINKAVQGEHKNKNKAKRVKEKEKNRSKNVFVFVCVCCHPRSALWLIILSSSPANRTNDFSLSLLLEIAAVSSGANGDREILIFLVQLTTSRIGNLTRLILALAIWDDYTSYSNVCVVVPFILDVRFVDVPAGVTQEEGHT